MARDEEFKLKGQATPDGTIEAMRDASEAIHKVLDQAIEIHGREKEFYAAHTKVEEARQLVLKALTG